MWSSERFQLECNRRTFLGRSSLGLGAVSLSALLSGEQLSSEIVNKAPPRTSP